VYRLENLMGDAHHLIAVVRAVVCGSGAAGPGDRTHGHRRRAPVRGPAVEAGFPVPGRALSPVGSSSCSPSCWWAAAGCPAAVRWRRCPRRPCDPIRQVLPPTEGWREVTVYFVRGSRLEGVPRHATEYRPQVAVDLLLAGPTRSEVMAGLRTALAPQDLVVISGRDGGGLVTIAVSREFAAIAGGNQLLAVAQVVWTVTQFPQVDRVGFTLDGALAEVPTDSSLTARPVTRADHLSVAPDRVRRRPRRRAPPPRRGPADGRCRVGAPRITPT
jgi:hypothetical protein